MYDVVVAGGSIAGLLCAREASAKGHSVLVVEEDHEIGTPEHCGGLISGSGLEALGVVPFRKIFGHTIRSAKFTAPDGNTFVVNAEKKGVIEISRRELDKQVAYQAQRNGAEIRVMTRLQSAADGVAKIRGGDIRYRILVDARGVSSVAQGRPGGTLASAQYEVCADWIRKGQAEVIFDQDVTPGFFAWVIPSEEGRGRVGLAGREINPSESLARMLEKRGCRSVLRKIFAPIWIRGPLNSFVSGTAVAVGDAAGQAKPTTAGGIFTGGMGGILAGRAISAFLESGDSGDLKEYQRQWNDMFGAEFGRQRRAREVLERISNTTINEIFGLVTPDTVQSISGKDDFDFHTISVLRLLGMRGTAKLIRTMARDILAPKS